MSVFNLSSNIGGELLVLLQGRDQALLSCLLHAARELDVESQVQVAFLLATLNRHALVFHEFASLRADLLVNAHRDRTPVQSLERHWGAFEGVQQGNLLLKDKIVALAAEVFVLKLLELDYQVGSGVSSCLVTLLFEDQFGAFRETWFDLDLLDFASGLDGLGIVLHNVLVVGDLLDAATEEFNESAFKSDHYVLRRTSSRLLKSSEAVTEDAGVDISALKVAALSDEVSLGEHILKVFFGLASQEVTAPDFLCKNRIQTR